MNARHLFFNHVGQTSDAPLALHIVKAKGSRLIDAEGRDYIDIIGGISVCNVGHAHPKVIEAITKQAEEYLHIMVYGELVQSPQVKYAEALTSHLPASLNNVFFTASGTEATEAAMKLAKRVTARSEIIAFKNSYHGSTQGSLSLMHSEYWQQPFRPLLPGIKHLDYNVIEQLNEITGKTACVIAETIQAEAGVIKPDKIWMQALRQRCSETNTLLILDEIQCGFGRNGTLWAFEQFGIVPDMLLLGKALGGGMPLGALVADKKLLSAFTHNPVLGHINTFGGHPVCCAAGLAAFEVLLTEITMESVQAKSNKINELLGNLTPGGLHSAGLMLALALPDFDMNKKVLSALLQHNQNTPAVFSDWFLFADNCLRLAPPLNISEGDLEIACERIADTTSKLL